MSRKTWLYAVLIVALLLAAVPTSPATAQAPAILYLMHGISGLDLGEVMMQHPVDISIAGLGCIKSNLMFRGYAGPFVVGPGTYTLSIAPANTAAPCSNAAELTQNLFVETGKPYVILWHLTAAGAPTVSQYAYDLSHKTKDNGKARFSIVNGAFAPSVDFYLRGRKGRAKGAFPDIVNAEKVTFQMKAGKYHFQFHPRGSATPIYGPINLHPVKFHHYFIALVGSPTNGFYTASLSINTYPLNLNPYNPNPWP